MVLLFQCHFPFLYLLSLERYAIHNIEAFSSIMAKLEIAKCECDIFFAIWTGHSAYVAMSTESERVKIDWFLYPNFM